MDVVEWSDGVAWDEFLANAAEASVMHLWGWKQALARSYGLGGHWLAATEGGRIVGVLPLVLTKSPIFGRHLVSMPFMDYGGVALSADHPEAETRLVARAQELADSERALLTLRCFGERPLDLPVALDKVTMLLKLGDDTEALFKSLPSHRRNRIRKGQKAELVGEIAGPEGLDEFYEVFAENMRDLGSPVHSRPFFREVMAALPDATRLVLVRSEGAVIGAGLMLFFRGRISIPWVSSLRPHFKKCPNQILYWEAMRYGIEAGHSELDFGRSSKGSGTFEAKRQWGSVEEQLHWYYHPKGAQPPTETTSGLGLGVRMWQKLPVSLANALGPRLRKGIPN